MKKFKYFGERKDKHGYEKSYDEKSLNKDKLERLKNKGWVEVKPKPKPKPKPKKKK